MADTSRDVSDLSATVAALTQERDEYMKNDDPRVDRKCDVPATGSTAQTTTSDGRTIAETIARMKTALCTLMACVVDHDETTVATREWAKRMEQDGILNIGGEIDAAITRAMKLESALQQAQTWQPISSAPQDGTWFLGWNADCGVFIWRDGPGLITGEDPSPTHWMPLPAPPAGGAAPSTPNKR